MLSGFAPSPLAFGFLVKKEEKVRWVDGQRREERESGGGGGEGVVKERQR